MADSIVSRTRRIGRFLFESGIVGQIAPSSAPSLAPFAIRHGVSIRTIHHIHARQFPHRVAMADERTSLTYTEANSRLNQICRAFAAHGIGRGDRVVLCMENRVEYLLFWFAALRAGIGSVHASYRSTTPELHYLCLHSGARAVIGSDRTSEAISGVAEKMDDLMILTVDAKPMHPRQHRYPDWATRFEDDFFQAEASEDGDNVVYTSGTTGKPKGAVRSFSSVGVTELSRVGERLPIRAGQRHLVVCPMYHSGAQAFAAMMTSLGCTIVLRKRFDALDALQMLSRWRIHSVFMVPTMIRRIVDLPEDVKRGHRTPELRALVSGAAAFPHALRERAIAMFGPRRVFDFYGATELGWITLIDGEEMLSRPGSVGRALSGMELRIAGDDRAALPHGEVGTIWVRNEQTMEGYLHDEAATAAAHDQGWITVDDLGWLDADGYLYLSGRNRDMVISGGVNIYPVEIEEVLAHHDDVDEVAVIGLPDDDLGERLVAVVVGSAEFDDLDAWAREHLAAQKVPRQWQRVDELPRNPTGKVLKRQLREQFSERP